MRLLLAFIFLLCSLPIHSASNHRFIVFIHDGTFYKLDPETKEVQWHNQLPFKLLSLDIAPSPIHENQNQTKKMFIPTVDGDFLYLEHSLYNKYSKQILVPREDVQHLLDMCFESKPEQKYFVYEKLEYFVLNTKNGSFNNLEDFLKQKSVFNKSVHGIMMVAKKLLKQLNNKMEIKWSVISSKIALVDVNSFVNSPKLSQAHTQHPKYSFVRIDSKTIQILDQNKNNVFDIQASSSIMNVFAEDLTTHSFTKILIKNSEHKTQRMLAIDQFKPNEKGHQISLQNGHFPQSQQQSSHSYTLDNLQICLKAHKILKQANEINQAHLFAQKPRIFFDNRQNNMALNFDEWKQFNPDDLPTLPFSSDRHSRRVIISKQQPYVYIFLIFIIVGGGLLFYRFKVNKLWEQISQMENITDQNMKKITAKLGQYENVGKQLKNMYQINWDKIIYRNSVYIVFEGRFLNQNVQVLMLPFAGFDIIDIQHKLNILLNCSHKHLSKLYYYTKNDNSLLIFSETSPNYLKLNTLNSHPHSQIFTKIKKYQQQNKSNIKIIMQSIYQLLNSKIQIISFCQESVLISQNLEIKINIIPSILEKINQEQEKMYRDIGTSRLRVDVVRVIHRMVDGGEFDLMRFEKEKMREGEQNSFLEDFYDHFLLTQHNPEDLQALRSAEKHPFLWDAKQKMLFVCDFSNYVETCIDDQKLSKMELHCKNFQVLPLPWNVHFHPSLAKELNNYRKYDFYSARDLIRLIRNKLSHFHEIPKETKVFVGKTPELFVEYILEKFPKLLSFMYIYATKKKWKLTASQ